ncbi:MAG: formate dehydrogenase [Pseudomonadota bacterium]|jgi:formate dehydrogenase region TAT target|nr:MAG: formate dehydrogenase [Pseudomonadota bacterium]
MAEPKLSRRKFMLSVGAGTAAAAAVVAAKAVPQANAAQQAQAPARKGYQLSEHVRKYYRTTLV